MEKRQSTKLRKLKEIWRRFSKNKTAMVGLVIVAVFTFAALFAGVLVPEDAVYKNHVMEKMQPPSAEHWFGTDDLGRDVFARVLVGTRYSLMVGVVTTLGGMLIGLFFAGLAAYYGGWVDNLIMRIMDILTSIPALLLAMSVVSALGASVENLFISLIVITVPSSTRLIRSAILNVVNQDYIEAARACGTSTARILTKHVLWNAIGTILVAITMGVATKIMTAASLSFLGLGFQPPTPEWGAMLSEARNYIRTAPYAMVFPGLAIAFASLGINLMGDGLRDAFDPKLKN